MSIGARGAWRIDAKGVLDVHGYMYFDGRSLFLQSADTERPIVAQGRPIGKSWISVKAPCAISVGNARIIYQTIDPDELVEDAETMALDHQPAKRPARPFEPGAFARRGGDDDEATRMKPVDASGTRAQPRPAAGMPPQKNRSEPPPAFPEPRQPRLPPPHNPLIDQATPIGVNFGRTVQGRQRTPHPPHMQMPPQPYDGGPGQMLNIPPPPGLPAQMRGPGGQSAWERLSGPKKILVFMSPFLLIAIYLLFRPEPQPQRLPIATPQGNLEGGAALNPYATGVPPQASHPIASGMSSGVPTVTTGPIVPTTVAPPVTAPPFVPTQPSATAPIFAFSAMPTTPPVIPPQPSPAPISTMTAANTKTLERTAVDLVTSGQFEKAAQIYDQLGTANPSNPAYREAARIVRAKLDGGN